MMIKTEYKFQNGVVVKFILDKTNKQKPINKTEWSCAMTKDNIEPLYREYVDKCIPFVYQQIADLTGQSIMWIDQNTLEHKGFKPQLSAN